MAILGRTIGYVLAFAIPPLLVGVIVTYFTVSDWIAVDHPDNLSPEEFPEPPIHDPAKPTAAVLVSNEGSESTDLLAPYGILAASGVLNVYTVAPRREVSPVWSGVDILPHLSFEDLRQRLGGSPDVIVIPNILDPEDDAIVGWVQRNAQQPTLVVSVCEGVRVLAASGLLHDRRASSHFLSLGQMERDYPTTEWTRGVRWVEDGNIITSAGVTASIDATLHALRRIAGIQAAERTAEKLGYRMELHPREVDPFDFRLTDFVSIFMTAGYLWDKTDSGVLVFDGMGEVDLGSVLDLYPRVFDGAVTTIAPARKPYRSRNGLDLVPQWSLEEAPDLDELLITGDASSTDLTSVVRDWVELRGMELKRPHSSDVKATAAGEPVFAYDIVLQDIASRRSKAVARAVAKWVEYPVVHIELSGPSWPFRFALIPLGMGLASVGLVRWLEKRRSANAKAPDRA